MDLGTRRNNARRGGPRRCGDTWRRMRGHRRTLHRRSRTERRRGRSRHRWRRCWTCHRGRRRWARHGRWWPRRSGCWRRSAACAVASSQLSIRTGAYRNRGDTKKKRCKANTARKHDRNSLVLRRPGMSTRRYRNRSRFYDAGLVQFVTVLTDPAGHTQIAAEAHPAAAHRLAVERIVRKARKKARDRNRALEPRQRHSGALMRAGAEG